jgi:hypothetical protein
LVGRLESTQPVTRIIDLAQERRFEGAHAPLLQSRARRRAPFLASADTILRIEPSALLGLAVLMLLLPVITPLLRRVEPPRADFA